MTSLCTPWALVAALALLSALPGCGERAGAHGVATVAAATSLRRVLPPLLEAYEAARGPGPTWTATYAASGTLRQQVEAGAPIDLVLMAGAAEIDRLVERGHCRAETRRLVATNVLVLIGPAGVAGPTFHTLAALAPDARIAVGDPASVPAGRYAKEALEALGTWRALEPRLVYGMDVAAVLAYVRRGEVAAGIVYRTETADVDGVVLLDEGRAPWAPTPEIVAAAVVGATHEKDARALLEFLAGARAREILEAHGFAPP